MSREHDVVTLSGAEYDALLAEAADAARLREENNLLLATLSGARDGFCEIANQAGDPFEDDPNQQNRQLLADIEKRAVNYADCVSAVIGDEDAGADARTVSMTITDAMVERAIEEYSLGDYDTPEQAMRGALKAAWSIWCWRFTDADVRLASAYQAAGILLDMVGYWGAQKGSVLHRQGTALLDMLSFSEAPIPDEPWSFRETAEIARDPDLPRGVALAALQWRDDNA